MIFLGVSRSCWFPSFWPILDFTLSGGAFAHRSTMLLASLLVPAAIFSKVLGCSLGASRFGKTVATRVGFGMIPRGEFCMVVAQVGLDLRVIPPDTFGVTVFMAVTVTLLTPLLLKYAFRGVLTSRQVEEVFRIE